MVGRRPPWADLSYPTCSAACNRRRNRLRSDALSHLRLFPGAHPMKLTRLLTTAVVIVAFTTALAAQEKLNVPPPGYVALFNGKDLTGWRGIPCRPNPNKKNADGVAPLTM